jgi:chemotaxis protein methyltransferase CheR
MDEKVFNKFRDIIYHTSGIHLNDKKEALVSARVAKRMRQLGMNDHGEYLRHVLDDKSGEEIVQLLDVISTNVTHFFREPEHFGILSREINKWYDSGQRRFRFWSAGCSSGEEPYTIAMTVMESLGSSDLDIKILATDISTRILRRCVEGVYGLKKMETVSPLIRDKYFDRNGRQDDTRFEIKEKLRRMIVFKRLNLSAVPFPMQGPMDAVFCRNVMIYFDNEVRRKLLVEISRLLRPGGYLFVGHAESLTGMLSGFRVVQPSVYVKP